MKTISRTFGIALDFFTVPEGRIIQPPVRGNVRELKHIGGLHHEYFPLAA